MTQRTDRKPRTFILASAHVYLPGSLPEDVQPVAPQRASGGCCGAATVPNRPGASACGTSASDTDPTARAGASCC